MNKRWLSVDEASSYLSVSRKTVFNLVSKGLLPFARIKGLSMRIDKKKLDEMFEAEEVVPIQEQLRG